MHRPTLLLALAGLSSLVACSMPVDSQHNAIIGGSLDLTDSAVVMVGSQSSFGSNFCTGVVVSPHVVLTAAQCVAPATVGPSATFNVFLGSDFNDTTQTGMASNNVNVASVDFDSAFDMNNVSGGHDIGVVVLESALTVKPLAINRSALAQSDVGATVRQIGYGVTDPSKPAQAAVRRQVTTTIETITNDLITSGDATHGTCNGDSGGPTLMMRGGQEVVIGLTSFGPQTCDGLGTSTRVDGYVAAFIDPRIVAADGEQATTSPDLGTDGNQRTGTTGQSGGCSMSSSSSKSGTGLFGWLLLLSFFAAVPRRR